ILEEHRGKGYAMKTFAHLRDVARSLGLRCVHLTVKRNNESSFNIYKHAGFEVVDSVDNPIGDGFVMYDYIMEMKV
ncbi:MAG: GNAT family N-acetyltransferase, partial [Candidatus Methanomethylophilaceae archaeon]